MSNQFLHPAQMSILYVLRHEESTRYTDLRMPTGLDSDVFKFHLRKLQGLKYVAKLDSGMYALTMSGKELANNLDKQKRAIQKQPKLSVMLVVSKIGSNGVTQYLFQERLRHPYWGYRGLISGPVRWGIAAEETARYEINKQTGLIVNFSTIGFFRQRDFTPDKKQLLEDKLFQVLHAACTDENAVLADYKGGVSTWMTLDELESTDKYFETTRRVIQMIEAGNKYISIDLECRTDHY